MHRMNPTLILHAPYAEGVIFRSQGRRASGAPWVSDRAGERTPKAFYNTAA